MLGAYRRVPGRRSGSGRGRGASGGPCSAPPLGVAVARRARGAAALPAPVRQGGAVPAPRSPTRSCSSWATWPRSSGARSSSRCSRPPGLDGRLRDLRHDGPLLQPVHPPPRARPSRSRSGSCSTGRGRAASSAPRRWTARCSARSASTSTRLYTGVFVIGSFLGGLGGALVTPVKTHRARDGHRDHRRGVHRRGDRRAGLVLGHLPRRAHLRPGAVLRHPVLPALLDLLGLRPHGRRAHHPPVGPARPAAG